MLSDSSRTRSSPASLNNMSAKILNIIRTHQTTTFSEVADQIIKECNGNDEYSNEKTTRRRVYDVLNVFLAAGLITKEAKNIKYVQSSISFNPPQEIPEKEDLSEKCDMLQEAVARKLKAYLLYRALLERNKTKIRPSGSVQLPAVFVEFPNDRGVSELSLDQKTLEISAEQHPSFYSPVDILNSLNLNINSQREFVRRSPSLSKFESLVFPDPIPMQPIPTPPIAMQPQQPKQPIIDVQPIKKRRGKTSM